MSDVPTLYHSQPTYSAVSSSLAILDQHGSILEVNDAWKVFGTANGLTLPDHGVGSNYFHGRQASLSPSSNTGDQGVKGVLSGDLETYDEIYPCHSPEHQRWFHLRVSRLNNRLHTMVIHEDITPLHDAQTDLLRGADETTRVLENIQEAFFSLDHAWRFTYLNPRAVKLLQQPAAMLLSRTFWEAFSEMIGTAFDRQFRLAVASQRPVRFEAFFPVVHAWFEVNAYPFQGSLAVYFQNINVRKAEQATSSERDVILEMIINSAALPEILYHVAETVERQLPGYVCVIMLEQDQKLYPSAAPSLSTECRTALEGLEVREGVWPSVTAMLRGERVVVESLAHAPYRTSVLNRFAEQGFQACVSVPLLDGLGEILGTLDLYTKPPGLFPRDVLQVMDKACHLATLATEHHRVAERVLYRAQYDALTGLVNRQLFEERLKEAVAVAHHLQAPLALLFIDVDDFKGINDLLGHEVGDQVLRELANRFTRCVQPQETLARISGDEFTVILPFCPQTKAVEVARSILDTLSLPFKVGGRELYVMVAIGISMFPKGGVTAETLQLRADLAMYHAKIRKQGFAVFEPELNRRSHERFQLGSDLRRALAFSELEVHYQPLVGLQDRVLVGVEALVRWRHPQLGWVPPGQFIPIAEEIGLITEIGEWVLRTACAQGAAWIQAGHPNIRMAVNVSALQFESQTFVETVDRCLQETGFPAAHLELELTERIVMRNAEDSVAQLKRLRALGIAIAIDDFGTGYSSLSYLARLPINILKIDRSFVSGLSQASANHSIVSAIVSLAASLRFQTVAEGIETLEELEALQELGCHLGQGYFFARACVAQDVFGAAGISQIAAP
ncbi:bifunctional diguanylate cyclase/phosphodiesterase [Deinococcus alpinitundrae]|uniref:bifunctional diguanylate cyclase/phosphodiesterase n=1 Tax=Deinococcus alpinitundrae TaxID=468913 RepID=UPI0013796AF2|nr:EAL domain-containing protein [Deinococcus alpinitundrae]